MRAVTTRTLNPLPFQDLEPHRFEDLVRQLAYDLRRWKSLEATGRSGTDAGLDIRGVEIVRVDGEPDEDEEQGGVFEERLWLFQCKREKRLAPKRVRKVIEETLVSVLAPPHGFVLAIACDVSKKARDTFREEMVARGIQDFAIWTRSELEDMLFQPRNDRLLFAYFGLSLQPRRRAVATTLRSQIAIKRQLTTLLADDEWHGKLILLRDPSDARYPREPQKGEPPAKWFACRAVSLKDPGHLRILRHEYLAATTPDVTKWDAIRSYDLADVIADSDLRAAFAWGRDERDRSARTPQDFWNEHIPELDRAYLKLYRWVPLARILTLDPLGDGYFPVPHVYVEFDDNGPFKPGESPVLERASMGGPQIELAPDSTNRVRIFPRPLPDAFDATPKEFDDTGDVATPLSSAAAIRLKTMLAPKAAGIKNRTAGNAADTRERRVRTEMGSFRQWRQKTAQPLFAMFVRRLRAAGHGARVVLRSVESKGERLEAYESVELRVQLQSSPKNPSYHPSGHIRLSISEYSGWRIDVWPPPETSGSGQDAVQPTVESMAKGELEDQALAMLERLTLRGY